MRQILFLVVLLSLVGCSSTRQLFSGPNAWQERAIKCRGEADMYGAELDDIASTGKVTEAETSEVSKALDQARVHAKRASVRITDFIVGRGVEGAISAEIEGCRAWLDTAEQLLGAYRLR